MDAATSLLLTALAHAGTHVIQNSVLRNNTPAFDDPTSKFSTCKPTNQTIYNFVIEQLNGSFTDLHAHRGQVLLIVNVATYCCSFFFYCSILLSGVHPRSLSEQSVSTKF